MAKKSKLKIGIIGAGVMGAALAVNLLKRKVVSKSQLVLSDKNESLLKKRRQELGVNVSPDSSAAVRDSDYIILAVKPQDFASLAKDISQSRPGKKVFLSIMAGVSIAKLKKHLATEQVVRAMPNLAAKVGQAFVVWKSGSALGSQEKKFVSSIFNSLGQAVAVSNEDDLNRATALSGSGPAYLYYFMESLAKAARDLGFSQELAQLAVAQTVRGAWALYEQAQTSPEVLRAQVTSKRGTTEAAIKSFRKNKFDSVIKKGIKAAYVRAKELSRT